MTEESSEGREIYLISSLCADNVNNLVLYMHVYIHNKNMVLKIK